MYIYRITYTNFVRFFLPPLSFSSPPHRPIRIEYFPRALGTKRGHMKALRRSFSALRRSFLALRRSFLALRRIDQSESSISLDRWEQKGGHMKAFRRSFSNLRRSFSSLRRIDQSESSISLDRWEQKGGI